MKVGAAWITWRSTAALDPSSSRPAIGTNCKRGELVGLGLKQSMYHASCGNATVGDAMKTAVVTGGGTGVARAIALKLANQGWRVAIVGRRIEALEETKRLAGPAASAITTHGCDVGNSDSVAATAKQILEQFG